MSIPVIRVKRSASSISTGVVAAKDAILNSVGDAPIDFRIGVAKDDRPKAQPVVDEAVVVGVPHIDALPRRMMGCVRRPSSGSFELTPWGCTAWLC
ncbi:MAG: hypothetical protein IPK16_31030 [Anaerolineales bacterium]|nr:hypothetical protein [Anaerolineales bacterium]